ncbi:MAG: hypothetical protein ACXABO_19960 [Promethearchaeota archaeon]|jgi:uncharacterized membrane protein
MVLYQLENPMRVITIYVAQMLVFLWFAYLAYRILSRDRKRLNLIFSGFYISAVIGFIFNFIYGPIANEGIVLVLNFLTNFGLFYAPIFLVVFDLILLKSEKIITTSKQLLILTGYGILMFGMIIFVLHDILDPNAPGWGVTLNATTEWTPVWELPFFLYLIFVESIFAVGPILYLSFRVYNKFEDEQLKKKWKSFIYGFCALIFFLYAIFISNFLDISIVRTIAVGIGLICAIVGGYLMYTGVGRQLEK